MLDFLFFNPCKVNNLSKFILKRVIWHFLLAMANGTKVIIPSELLPLIIAMTKSQEFGTLLKSKMVQKIVLSEILVHITKTVLLFKVIYS